MRKHEEAVTGSRGSRPLCPRSSEWIEQPATNRLVLRSSRSGGTKFNGVSSALTLDTPNPDTPRKRRVGIEAAKPDLFITLAWVLVK